MKKWTGEHRCTYANDIRDCKLDGQEGDRAQAALLLREAMKDGAFSGPDYARLRTRLKQIPEDDLTQWWRVAVNALLGVPGVEERMYERAKEYTDARKRFDEKVRQGQRLGFMAPDNGWDIDLVADALLYERRSYDDDAVASAQVETKPEEKPEAAAPAVSKNRTRRASARRGCPSTYDPLQDEKLLADWKASGQTARQFERDHGLSTGTVRHAHDRQRKRRQTESGQNPCQVT